MSRPFSAARVQAEDHLLLGCTNVERRFEENSTETVATVWHETIDELYCAPQNGPVLR